MNKIVSLLIALFVLSVVCKAQSGGFPIGYCDGQLTTTGTPGFYSDQKDIWVSGAVYISEGQAKMLAGNHVDKIRAGLVNKTNVDSLRIWIRTSLDGENMVSSLITGSTTPALAKGWNEVTFDEPYQITEDTGGFYMGYSFHQKRQVWGLSIAPQPQPGALFVQYGNGEWADCSDSGALCIEGFVFGDNLPQYDLQLESVSTHRYYVISSGELEVTANVRNMALSTINNYKAICQFDGYEDSIVVDVDQSIAYNERQQVKFVITPSIASVPDRPVGMTITLDNLSEGQDQNIGNNTAQTSFLVLDNAYPRNVLVEEFTTERCRNCPTVANMLHETMDKPAFSNVILWEHHSGFGTDNYTTEFDQDYEWFYGNEGMIYAPALMFDRTPRQSYTPLTVINNQAELESIISELFEETSPVCVNIQANYLDDGALNVVIDGTRVRTDFATLPPRITVALVEDNIETTTQAGASGTFTHHNVGRAVNAVWGEEFDWNGDNYQYNCSFEVNDDWVKDNLAIIAFVSVYDSTNPVGCGVANSNILRAADFGHTSEIVTGDVNGDGEVNITDVNAIINLIITGLDNPRGDVNGDGEINITDINAVINIITGQ